MKQQYVDELNQLFNPDQPPAVEDVRDLRRRLAADPESTEWAETLMEVEKGLEAEDSNYGELRKRLPLDQLQSVRLTVSIDDREPFPGLRKRLLQREIDRLGGEMEAMSDTGVRLTLPGPSAENRIRALSHWSEGSGKQNSTE